MAEDNEFCNVVLKGPYVPTIEVKERQITRVILKT